MIRRIVSKGIVNQLTRPGIFTCFIKPKVFRQFSNENSPSVYNLKYF